MTRARPHRPALARRAGRARRGRLRQQDARPRSSAETEGIYVSVDDLTYQVQISRILNPASAEDEAYLKGLPEDEEPAADEVWFGVFMRVENETDEELTAAEGFKIVDTQETEFEPVELDTERQRVRLRAAADPARRAAAGARTRRPPTTRSGAS